MCPKCGSNQFENAWGECNASCLGCGKLFTIGGLARGVHPVEGDGFKGATFIAGSIDEVNEALMNGYPVKEDAEWNPFDGNVPPSPRSLENLL